MAHAHAFTTMRRRGELWTHSDGQKDTRQHTEKNRQWVINVCCVIYWVIPSVRCFYYVFSKYIDFQLWIVFKMLLMSKFRFNIKEKCLFTSLSFCMQDRKLVSTLRCDHVAFRFLLNRKWIFIVHGTVLARNWLRRDCANTLVWKLTQLQRCQRNKKVKMCVPVTSFWELLSSSVATCLKRCGIKTVIKCYIVLLRRHQETFPMNIFIDMPIYLHYLFLCSKD